MQNQHNHPPSSSQDTTRKRERLSVDLDANTHQGLNRHLKGLRLKSALFNAIADKLVEILDTLPADSRTVFIAAILEKKLDPSVYLPVDLSTLRKGNKQDETRKP